MDANNGSAEAIAALKSAVLTFQHKPVMAKAHLPQRVAVTQQPAVGVVVNMKSNLPKKQAFVPSPAPRVVRQPRVAVAAAR